MDKRSQFYLDCLKYRSMLSDKVISGMKLKDFNRILNSDEYNAILNSGDIYIGEGQVPGTWIAVYTEPMDEDTFDEIELVFEGRPSVEAVRFAQYLLSIEDYLSDPYLKPYVEFDDHQTHWTLLPFDFVQEKWEQFILLRDEQTQ